MGRPLRLTYQGALHHVTLRCNNKEFLFDEESWRMFMDLLAEACHRFEVRLRDYCLMTNHVHVDFQVPADGVLSNYMHWLANVFAKRFNLRRNRKGHFWENRFHSTIIQPGCNLKCMAYIDLNPVRAGMVQSPADHRWSGHSAIRAENQMLLRLDPSYLALGNDRTTRYAAYLRVIEAEAAKKPFSLANVLFFGNKEFVEQHVERFGLGSTIRPRVNRIDLGGGIWGVEPIKGGSCSQGARHLEEDD